MNEKPIVVEERRNSLSIFETVKENGHSSARPTGSKSEAVIRSLSLGISNIVNDLKRESSFSKQFANYTIPRTRFETNSFPIYCITV